MGRRKSWIVPIQAIIGISMLLLGTRIDAILAQDNLPVTMLAAIFTVMVFLCATQDIAVDGWALTLLHDENKPKLSNPCHRTLTISATIAAQTIGLNTGYFLSFTVFLALNSPEVCNTYLRSSPQDDGILQLGAYLQFWGVMFLICNAWLIFVQKEAPETSDVDEIKEVYQTMARICVMPHMKQLIAVLLLAKIGFMANDAVTGLKLLDRGFQKEDLALAVLIDFPLQITFGYYAARWSNGPRPLRPWLYAFCGRLVSAVIGMIAVYGFPSDGVVTTSYFGIVMVAMVFNSFMSTVQFVGLGSYFTKISDPSIGGTYMTLLNTLSNLGGTWPKYFVLKAVDYFTVAPCTVSDSFGKAIKCTDDPSKEKCFTLGGTCDFQADGYFIVNIACVAIGSAMLIMFILPHINSLEKIPDRAWRLNKEDEADRKK
eukprot:jgi/Hompol1/1453/HPOL_000959-RA